MARQWYALDEIEVDVRGFFTTHHDFGTGLGSWGKLTFPAFANHGTFRAADGRELLMRKVHWLGSAHEFSDGGRVRGSADRAGVLSREIELLFDGQHYVLEPEGILSRGWRLTDAQGRHLLEIQPRGILRQGAYLTALGQHPEMVEALSPDLLAFAYYLVYTRWQEDAAAGAAAAS